PRADPRPIEPRPGEPAPTEPKPTRRSAVPEPVPDLSPSPLFSSPAALDHPGARSPPGKDERHPALGPGARWQAHMAHLRPPSRLFSSTGALDHLGAGSPPGKNERHPGLGLGDSWQAQMAQIGLMAGTFAGLVALCGGGGCMKYMPDNFLPDFLVTEESATT